MGPPASAAAGQEPPLACWHTAGLQEVGDGLAASTLLEPITAQLATQPGVDALQVALAAGVSEVRHPSRKKGVQFRERWLRVGQTS